MVFNTYWFLCFGAVFFPLFWLLRPPAARRAWLLAGCLIFHAHFAGPAGMLPVLALAALTYVAGLLRARWLRTLAIAVNVLALGFYKYATFVAADLLARIAPGTAAPIHAQLQQWLPAAPPLAISFFVFEFVHYLIEVARGQDPIRRPDDFLLFTLHFPSLVAGPIKRYSDYLPNLRAGLAGTTVDDVAAGATRLALGVAKKILLADNLNLMIAHYGGHYRSLDLVGMWWLLAGITARILLDFSGYSDMAIGLSRMMGVRLPENFNSPYIATSLRDFWQRWHISLTSWIRDYVYIPLGGGRHGPIRKLLNGLLVFALCGLWHGAAWQFVLWGLWHGAGLAVSTTYARALGWPGRTLESFFARVPLVAWALTLLYVALGWLLFFYEPAIALEMSAKLFGLR